MTVRWCFLPEAFKDLRPSLCPPFSTEQTNAGKTLKSLLLRGIGEVGGDLQC